MTRPLLLLLATLAACRPAPAPVADTPAAPDTTGVGAALMAADRAFGDSTAARGLDGWMRFYAKDAVRLTMGTEAAQGTDAVRAHDARLFADSTLKLVWTPTHGGAFADGTHGFTTGTSAMVKVGGAAPDTVYRGAYVTIWRRDADGTWRVILDTGA